MPKSTQAVKETQDLWRRFAEANNPQVFYESWLVLQCTMLKGVRCALLLIGAPDTGPFTPAAVFPNPSYNVTHLAPTAERALKDRRGLAEAVSDGDTDLHHVAYPIDISGRIHGAVVLEVKGLSSIEVQEAMRQLHWGAAWLEVMLRRAEVFRSQETVERLQKVLDAVAGVIEHDKFRSAAMEFVTGIATKLECDRVSIGFKDDHHVCVAAISHSAEFDKHTNLVATLESVMDEAVDQQAVIIYPLLSDAPPLVTLAHEKLTREHGVSVICTVPLMEGGSLIGGMTLERLTERPFDESTIELVKTVAALAGPILEARRREERGLPAKAAKAAEIQVKKFTGPAHFGLKLAAVLVFVGIIFFTFAKGVHRVKAPTVLEGIVQRSVGAPFNGYVVEAPARPGDVVRQGAMLCRLDDRELTLERLKWWTQREQAEKQYSEAMAKHDRAQVLINEAKMDQAEAQVSLLDEQLSRTKIVAPFDGIVTSGDFSQSLGTPVERGQVLFEVAPLRGYRVIVQVDERDIGWVAIGQKGKLVLPSIPGTAFPLEVTRITPISTAKEGRNYFRVEADLQKTSPRLRPGMEGVAKVGAGHARLIWIWTHDVTEWIRLKIWSWWP
ncbi:HlyD family efflux transporter periplasmic adaptor subunit [Syntrophorhabdus aromaticivorans]|uniref:HlyD family efflux transporter periplasmic adaptor subunit n=1 Tax=Syntrophorhabdus aromaticivorans TaxID=328301 RepID=A0A971S1X6_9BACT|nr:HlyD family efflux transporter periplasmic adaptor subunit [Syntrophorhabdus aromaticivorans]NLW35717.1 HlyD family efflux transporter periplasmic adaptor subunit [Syntrophorhabdus aromaticivorans]